MATEKGGSASKGGGKKGASKKGAGKKGAGKGGGKREMIDTGTDKRFVRRDERGRFNESDDVGRSLAQDIKRPAKTKVPSGQGDKGDQKRGR
ncbi:MAG TPA: hypothetical protein VK421_10665 [Pyrinomonadaceae bacterium]|nr:hypothetical protein [Pyrinomonadaceae bacterium]